MRFDGFQLGHELVYHVCVAYNGVRCSAHLFVMMIQMKETRHFCLRSFPKLQEFYRRWFRVVGVYPVTISSRAQIWQGTQTIPVHLSQFVMQD